ncbi:MAG: Uma2 family endonuclease [Cytophagaceae bacterium]|nr:Uma2 family endonuclease [Gemmatimonadaceae bacterium]
MVSLPKPMTAEQLSSLDLPDQRAELVRGHLIVSEPPGFQHGDVTARVTYALSSWLREASRSSPTPLGRIVAGDSGFWIERSPDTVRAPDVAFVRQARLPAVVPVGFAQFAPNLVVEVLSPSDRAGKVLEKVADWLKAGTELVWVIDPDRRVARAYRADGSTSTLDASRSLEGDGVLPGLTLPLIDLFD